MSEDPKQQELPLVTLTAMVVDGMVGTGCFRSRQCTRHNLAGVTFARFRVAF